MKTQKKELELIFNMRNAQNFQKTLIIAISACNYLLFNFLNRLYILKIIIFLNSTISFR